jgi:hypothetical protein
MTDMANENNVTARVIKAFPKFEKAFSKMEEKV